jgi:nitrogen fixation/metabolism regulation signal transduction histidine kinase
VLSNVISALKEEDLSFRARHAFRGDALGDLAIEINELARALEKERLGGIETINILRRVMAEVGAVIMAFSPDNRLRLLNGAGVSLLGRREVDALHRTAGELGISDLLEGPASETISRSFSNMESRWIVRRTYLRLQGVPHRMVVLSEASEALRKEERSAWQRVIRVLSHEINNSLAPIKSIARTLDKISKNISFPDDVKENFHHGLEVIGSRAESLNRFLQGYAQLAKLPPPTRHNVPLQPIMERVVRIESRLPVTLVAGPDVIVYVDPDQFEHALINLIKNAVEAVLLNPGAEDRPDAVTVSWKVNGRDLLIRIQDRGIGLSNTENLFVPFYTTKESGTGIGLLLSRQVVEAHAGMLRIHNREDAPGCEVKITLSQCIDVIPSNLKQ